MRLGAGAPDAEAGSGRRAGMDEDDRIYETRLQRSSAVGMYVCGRLQQTSGAWVISSCRAVLDGLDAAGAAPEPQEPWVHDSLEWGVVAEQASSGRLRDCHMGGARKGPAQVILAGAAADGDGDVGRLETD